MPVIKERFLSFGNKSIRCIYRTNRRIKRLSLKITQFGEVELLFPPRFPVYQAENFLNSHLGLIEKRIVSRPASGERMTFLGKEIKISFVESTLRKKIKLTFADGTLEVEANPGLNLRRDTIYKQFLKIKTSELIIPMAHTLAKKHGFFPTLIKQGRGNTRWGSCTSKGVVSLNFMLAALPEELIEYVIIHEFCHLRFLNHSRQFWNEVEKIIPAYRDLRKHLKGLML